MAADRWLGQILGGRYQILELVGRGGMSTVYKARDPNVQRMVAIKLFHPHLSDTDEFVRRFEAEAATIARLRHPNIVHVYDFNHDGDQYYMVLEFIAGETLQNRIKRTNAVGRHLPVRDTLRYMIDICKAADYAHQRGMIHRDIKPANIMLDVHGSAILMDFGIARIVGGQQHTATGAVLGTALYMSPEQIQGLHTDARADIYSIGVTLFEALGGRPPFEADSAMTLMMMHLNDPVPDLTSLNPAIPEAVRAIVNHALEKDRANRFQTCAEMAAAMEQELNNIPVELDTAYPPVAAPSEVTPAPPAETAVETPATIVEQTFVEPPAPVQEPAAPVLPQEPQAAEALPTIEEQPPGAAPAGEPPELHPTRRKLLQWGAAVAFILALITGIYLLYRQANPFELKPTPKATSAIHPTATITPGIPPTATVQEVIPPILPSPARGELKIAVLAPLSGSVPYFGVETRDAVLMAVDEWNARGGVLGKKIVPIILDSQCTPDPAVEVASNVIDQEKVHYLIGEVCSKASIPVSEIANERGVVMISPSSTNPQVTMGANDEVKTYVFRACFIDSFQGLVGAKFAFENLKAKTAFIMVDPDNPYGVGLAEFFEQSFTEMGGKIVGKGTYAAAYTDFSAILKAVVEAKPDVIYLPDYYPVVNLVTRQAKERGINVPFLGSDGWDSAELDRVAASGSYFTNHYSTDDPRPEVKRFVAAFGERYRLEDGKPRIPDSMAALAYDATNILLQSIQESGVDDPAVVKDTMAKLTFQGVTGRISFDLNHNPIKSAAVLAVRDGKIVFETTINP